MPRNDQRLPAVLDIGAFDALGKPFDLSLAFMPKTLVGCWGWAWPWSGLDD